jgi:heme-degrading monooxygenase HmoA
MFVILWEFEVKPGCEQSFESANGPEGAWPQLFRRSPGYLKTLVLKDPSRTHMYLTLDFWHSESAFQSFRNANYEAYLALDRSMEGLTFRETHVGSFTQTPTHNSSV